MAHHSHLHWLQCPGQYLLPYWQFVQRVENRLKCYILRSRHKPWPPFLPIDSMSMLMANYPESGFHNLFVLPFRLWVLLAHYQFPSSTFIDNIVHQMSAYSLRPDSQSMALVVVSALVQSHHQSIQNCLFLCALHCPLLCEFCHLLLCHHLIISSSVSWSLPSFSLSHPLSSSSTLVLQFSLSKHSHVHLPSTLPQSGQTKVT